MKKNLLVLLVCINLFAITSFAQTYNLHWGSTSWVGPTYSKAIPNVGGSGININVGIVNSSAAGNVSAAAGATNNAFQYNTPTVGAALVAWYLPGSTGNSPLAMLMDWDGLTSTVTTTITFSQPVTDVQFYLGDMDRTTPLTYVDRFTFTGSKNGVAVPNPIISKYQGTVTGADTVLINANQAYGNGSTTNNYNAGTSSPTNQGATILLQYGTPVTQIVLFWDQGPGSTGNPAIQGVVIGDISFTKISPAVSPQAFSPVANNFTNSPMPQSNGPTLIPSLTAADPDGVIANYSINTFPTASEGVLSFCSNGTEPCTGTVTTISSTTVLTPAQMATLKFDPAPGFVGTAQFTFTATNATGDVSNTGIYKLPVVAQLPVSNNIMENVMANTNGPTVIVGLNSTDADGTIASYQITSLPTAAQGVLSIPCPPTPSGATCAGGFADLTAAVLTANPGGILLTAAQKSGMRFDPTSGYIGNATFNYNAIDNSGNVSNTANYTIPIAAIASTLRPPLAENISAQTINSSLGNTAIPALQAHDLDGIVVSYTVSTIPPAGQGMLRLSCPSTPTGLTCMGGFADIIAGTVLTSAESGRLFFDPAPGYTGTASFTYTALDNSGLQSNTATYNLPIVNTAPVSTNVTSIVPFNGAATAIPALAGSDNDGNITNYTITSVPTAAEGILSIPCPPTPIGATCTGGFANLTPAVLAANPSGIILTPIQAAAIRFAPTTGFSGSVPFNYTSTDNTGNVSAPALYNIKVALQPPVTTDVIAPLMPNTNGPTAVSSLAGTDADGSIASYTLLSVPDASQGVFSIPCPATPTGATCTGGFANLTSAVLAANVDGISLTPTQAAGLRFDPTAGYTGIVAMNYKAIDNSGLSSNVSIYTVPVSGTGNIVPVAKNVLTPPMANTNGPTAIPTLNGSDADGTIASYTLKSVPSASQGVLSIPCPATPTGATCIGGFADLTPAVLADPANVLGIVLTPAQAAAMRFDPNPNFAGNVDISYVTIDNSGSTSAGAGYRIPVTSQPPIANAVTAPSMPQTNGPTTIPSLLGSDVDGTIASFVIETIPPTIVGVLSIPCPPTPTGATCTGGFANLTEAVLANYPFGGIPLTPTQSAAIRFDPAPGYQGTAVFNYHAIDNSGLVSNATNYSIPVSGMPPLAKNVVAPKMLNSNGQTPIPDLSASDPDGAIANYVINNIPPASQGILYYNNGTGLVPVVAGQSITPAQAATLQFDPAPAYNGDVIFNYTAFDNNGNISNVATYTIPTGTASVLPITLISFSGQRDGLNIIANWKSENEQNIDHFEVEYSTDAVQFKKGGVVTARNMNANDYQLTLINYTLPVYYLRLKTIDNTGAYRYSALVTVKFAKANTKTISIFPNPIKDKFIIKTVSDITANAEVKIIDALGQVIHKTNALLVRGENILYVNDFDRVRTGIYFVQIIINGEILSSKIEVIK